MRSGFLKNIGKLEFILLLSGIVLICLNILRYCLPIGKSSVEMQKIFASAIAIAYYGVYLGYPVCLILRQVTARMKNFQRRLFVATVLIVILYLVYFSKVDRLFALITGIILFIIDIPLIFLNRSQPKNIRIVFLVIIITPVLIGVIAQYLFLLGANRVMDQGPRVVSVGKCIHEHYIHPKNAWCGVIARSFGDPVKTYGWYSRLWRDSGP